MARITDHRILLIDDDVDESFLTSRALKGIGGLRSLVFTVESGEAGIDYLAGDGQYTDRKKYLFPTLIITDLRMPHGDGFDVLEFLQGNPEWSVVPRIVFSSAADDDDVRTAYFLGASAYHVKPSTLTQRAKCMRAIIEYWAQTEVPPVDVHGRLIASPPCSRGSRFPQTQAGEKMKRAYRRR